MTTPDLFATETRAQQAELTPLAERMRPRSVNEVVGQDHLLAEGSPLYRALTGDRPHSFVLWGPPGTGKTSMAMLMADRTDAHFEALSAVGSGLADVRRVLGEAAKRFEMGRRTVLFVDEVHRFNKAQQDAFLPGIEKGHITFVGATTENPSFELNAALLSRSSVYVLESLSAEAIATALKRTVNDGERGLGTDWQAEPAAIERMAHAADGDLRRALGILELTASQAGEAHVITEALVEQAISADLRRFDKRGDAFYDQISALHKSVRNSNPDAALYWLNRMLDGGTDPEYLARRLLRMAIEDIGLADPRAQTMALEAWQIYERLGSPEGELALGQVAMYLSLTPKSNAGYAAFNKTRKLIRDTGSLPVPMHFRNAPTKLMKNLGWGKNYQYDPNAEGGFAADQQCFPDALGEMVLYEPQPRGLEIKLTDKLNELRAARAAATSNNPKNQGDTDA